MLNSINEKNAKKDEKSKVYYITRSPWQWVIDESLEKLSYLFTSTHNVTNPKQLPSVKTLTETSKQSFFTHLLPPSSQPFTMRLDLLSMNEEISKETIITAIHGTSTVLKNLEDKDVLCRTLIKWNCEHLCPPTILLPWDVCDEQKWKVFCGQIQTCLPHVFNSTYDHNSSSRYNDFKQMPAPCAVLKTPLGSRGEGIYFVNTLQEIYDKAEKNKQNALAEKGFLKWIQKSKGRIPSWVLQAEIYPPFLIREKRKKFHLRSYVLIMEDMYDGYDNCNISIDESYTKKERDSKKSSLNYQCSIYKHHEVRIASESFISSTTSSNDNRTSFAHCRQAYITNGAGSDKTERCLLPQVPELVSLNVNDKLDSFMAEMFGVHLLPEIQNQIRKKKQQIKSKINNINTTDIFHKNQYQNNKNQSYDMKSLSPHYFVEFTIAGVDIMMNSKGQLYLLEMNVNPAAPPKSALEKNDNGFHQHLVSFLSNLIQKLLQWKDSNLPITRKKQNDSCDVRNIVYDYDFIPIEAILEKNADEICNKVNINQTRVMNTDN